MAPTTAPLVQVSSLAPRVLVRSPVGGLLVEVFETLDGAPRWVPLEVDDLAADMVALGWALPDAEPVDDTNGDTNGDADGVEFLRVSFSGMRVWVDGRRVSAHAAADALARGLREAVLAGARAELAEYDAAPK